jgi:DNA replication protein DnaC
MLTTQTLEKLHAMKLQGMAEALEEQRRESETGSLGFEDRFGLLVERQWLWKEDRAMSARLKYAGLKQQACLEDITYRAQRGLKRDQIEQLRASHWVREGHNCLITGPTGTGKTWIACALGHQACRDGYRVLYFFAPKLFRALKTAQADGSMMKLLKRIARTDLLILDDISIEPATARQYRDLLEILDDRNGIGATLVTGQLPVGQWHEIISDATVADALLDRLVHNAYRIELTGKSMRKKTLGKKG